MLCRAVFTVIQDAGACSGLHQQPTEDEEALLDIVALLLQLLAALLLQTFPARPVVGSLDPSLAADTAAALLKVCMCAMRGPDMLMVCRLLDSQQGAACFHKHMRSVLQSGCG